MRGFVRNLAGAFFLTLPITSHAQQVYFNDFEGGAGSEWSANNTSVTPVGARRFLGEFANQTTTLSLGSLPIHNSLTLEFDLFVIRTWDGNNSDAGGQNGPDVYKTSVVGGATLLDTTFSNVYYFPNFNQSYPNSTGMGNFAPMTGAEETNSLGYIEPGGNPADAVYHFSFSFAHSASSVQLAFTSLQTESIANESWGLDNVRVTAVPEPASLLVLSALTASVLRRRRK